MNKKKTPIISIIVPSFNEEKHIGSCLDSILNQTFTDFEIICVDDRSTDNTYSIIENYQLKDERIKLFKNPDKGVSSARNFGIEQSKGNFISFVDADDSIQPQMFEFLYKALCENSCEMTVCRYERGKVFKPQLFEFFCRKCLCNEFVSFDDFYFNQNNEMIIASSCFKLIKRTLLERCETFKDYRIGEDTIFCANLWNNCKDVYLVDLPLYFYYDNEESVTHVANHDDKIFDYILSRFICYDIFKNYITSAPSSYYLDRGMKYLLSYNFYISEESIKNIYRKKMNELFFKYIFRYLKCEEVSIKHRLSVPIFFIFPFLYKKFRKVTDKTL